MVSEGRPSVKWWTKFRSLSRGRANEARSVARVEPRWPVALATFAVLSLFSLMPERSSLLPSWFGLVIGIAVTVLMIGVWLAGNRARWLRVERAAMLALATALLAMTLLAVTYLVIEIIDQSTKFAGRQLLTVGIEAWVTNVLAFSIVYWDIDRGGPETREVEPAALPDWLFPQAGVPNEVAPGWRPTYVDYLFLAFSTATAFSATDVTPLTVRAKLLMMLESCISLATLAIVASRAINILGS
jgi:uncharacterized membrane protein YozB (DUF420 family)